MESPISRTSSSHSIYAPGPHRRSHPNLQHLSLAPLTPRYPIDPADYLAYHDPSTSNLHTSASISHIASLPSPGGILTNSPARSRNTSRTRLLKRKVKSHVNIVAPADGDTAVAAPSGAVSSAGYGFSGLHPLQQPRTAKSHTNLSTALLPDASWLVQTGLALTESSRENKGQSWLGKRDSSTSLVGLVTAPVSPVEERGRVGYGPLGGFQPVGGGYPYSRSGRATPRSRGNSRHGSRSRMGSRRFLAMTSTVGSEVGSPTSPTEERARQLPQRAAEEEEEIQPDWADAASRAEYTSSHQHGRHSSEYFSEPATIEEEEDGNEAFYDLPDEDDELDDDDPYGQLNLAEHFDNGSDIVDEEEVRRELREHSRQSGVLGRWFDGVVDVFMMLEEEDGQDNAGGEGARRLAEVERGFRDGQEAGKSEEKENVAWFDGQSEEQQDVEPPPEGQQGVWGDVKWLGRLVARSIG